MLICITGPECSGKTALTAYLAEELDASPVYEFARVYLSKKDGEYTYEDLEIIARGQVASVRAAGDGIVITDTFLLVIMIWSMHKYAKASDAVKNLFVTHQPDVYLLCKPDLPWEHDALREHEHERDALFEQYLERIQSSGIPCILVEGEGPERMPKALERLKSIIQKKLP